MTQYGDSATPAAARPPGAGGPQGEGQGQPQGPGPAHRDPRRRATVPQRPAAARADQRAVRRGRDQGAGRARSTTPSTPTGRRSSVTDATLLERYRLVDVARKVVGVGSVGTRCWVVLLAGRDAQDPLFLQVKEAEASVLEPYLGGSEFAQHGQRVVEGQRVTQAASDIFLGLGATPRLRWPVHDYYFRQLWDWKVSADIDAMELGHALRLRARSAESTLARSHARTGDGVAISAYVGRGGPSLRPWSSSGRPTRTRTNRTTAPSWPRSDRTSPRPGQTSRSRPRARARSTAALRLETPSLR